MARIPLRTYNREVENLIERGQIEEAIAHCKNILKQFPKHIETYRLLGKSFLESQRYAEAADILQRVLSVFPDDFVSQLGMSIIREDEGNLDAAIWYMERAYEVQPFNRPVQDELRRLYGRRDGAEPPRIRLTRGALVRMYARGDLYPQAIAEIRAAQAEDPSRIDLIVLLAKMYYLSGQKIEATEISSSLITKLPYCYEANRILMEVLPETSRADDARIFQQRLFSLDPYAAFISPNAPTSGQVPEQTVMVEKVDWQPSMTDAQAPDWAKTIGVEWDEPSEENLPDWLSTIQPGQAEPVEDTTAPVWVDEQPSAAVKSSDELIPEFLKDAGWQPSDGTVEEQPLALDEEKPGEEEEIVEADIPEWLQSLAPDIAAVSGVEDAKEVDDQMGWLEGILPAGAAAAAGAAIEDELTQPEEIQGAEDEGFAFPEGLKGELQESSEPADWIHELSTDSTDQVTEQAPAEEEPAEVPDWLAELSPAALEESTAGEEKAGVEPAAVISDEIPDWIKQDESELPASETAVDTMEPTPEAAVEQETIPDWLTEPSTEVPQEITVGEETTSVEMPAPVTDEVPDWIKQAEIEEPVSETGTEAVESITEEESVPDWLAELKQETTTETASEYEKGIEESAQETIEITPQEAAVPATDEMDIDSALAWMEALAARQGADEDSLKISAPDQRSETPPEWIAQLEEATPETPSGAVSDIAAETATESVAEGEETIQAKEETPEIDVTLGELASTQEEIPSGGMPADELASLEEIETPAQEVASEAAADVGAMDADAAFAWLESLAAKQGAEEGSLVTAPEERPETPPEWVSETIQEPSIEETELISAVADELPETGADVVEETTPGMPSEAIAQPMDEEKVASEVETVSEIPSAEETAQAVEPVETVEAEIPDWLRSYEEEQRAQEPVWKPDETFTPETVAEEELPDWLREEASETPAAESVLPQSDIAEQVTSEMPSAENVSDMPEWLKELQETQPVQEHPEASPQLESSWVQEFSPEPLTPVSDELQAPPPASDTLALAQATLRSGDIESAAEQYTQIINTGQNLDVIIEDLKNGLDQYPVDVSLWQALGDAYIRSNRVQEALDAYTKAEELLR